MKIEYIEARDLIPPDWRIVHTLKPDLRLITESIQTYGWLSPLIVQKSNLTIIDGFHRDAIAQTDKLILSRDKGIVPVMYLDVTDGQAMILHIKLNRGRGEIVPYFLSQLVLRILESDENYDEDELQTVLGMTNEEFSLLLSTNLLKQRKISEHSFSKAWIPYESNVKSVPIKLERPPNPDS